MVTDVPEGFSPQHIEFDPTGSICYVSTQATYRCVRCLKNFFGHNACDNKVLF